MPTTRSGCGTAVAISVTLSAEVLVAISAPGTMCGAAVASTSFFTARFSVTVSTSSAAPSAACARSGSVVSRALAAAAAAASTLPSLTPSSRIFATAARALAAAAALLSTSMVVKPDAAKAWAMPVPIRPAPTTTTLSCVMLMVDAFSGKCSVQRLDDVAQRADAGDLCLDHVPDLQEPAAALRRAGGRTGEEDVAALEA